MKVYYYDDCGAKGDHWQDLGELADDETALKIAEELKNKYQVFPCILYDEDYRTVKEWRPTV